MLGICLAIAGWVYMFPQSISTATCTRVSNALGGGDGEAASRYVKAAITMVAVQVGWGCVWLSSLAIQRALSKHGAASSLRPSPTHAHAHPNLLPSPGRASSCRAASWPPARTWSPFSARTPRCWPSRGASCPLWLSTPSVSGRGGPCMAHAHESCALLEAAHLMWPPTPPVSGRGGLCMTCGMYMRSCEPQSHQA